MSGESHYRRLLVAGEEKPRATSISFSRDGSRVFGGGSSATLNMLLTEDEEKQEPVTSDDDDTECVITCMVACADWLLVGWGDGVLRRYRSNTVTLSAFVTSFPGLSVRCVAVDPKGQWVGAASEDPKFKLINMEDQSLAVVLDNESGARQLSWHPTKRWLTVCGQNGVITIWDVTDEAKPSVLKKIDGIIPAVKDTESEEAKRDCIALWHHSGDYFFVANKAHEIVIISSSKWEKIATLPSNENVSGTPSALAMSVNGLYLAAAYGPSIHVWSTTTRKLINTLDTEIDGSEVTRIAFSPTQNSLAYTDDGGWYGRFLEPVPGAYASPVKPRPGTRPPPVVEEEDVAAESDGEETMASRWDDTLDQGAPESPKFTVDFNDDYDDQPASARRATGIVSLTEAQLPFQPGSTPKDQSKRYLAYTTLGVIEATDHGTYDMINVEFFNRSARRQIEIKSALKYDMGYLGERGAVFACSPAGESTAQVLFRPYATWSAQTEWSYDLKQPNIHVICIAAGSMPPESSLRESNSDDLQGLGHVVIATSDGDLTFLSGTGRERRIMGFGGDVISMVASEEWVFVVRRVGSTTPDGSQNLSYVMINFDDFTVRQSDALPISKGHILKWIGITEEGAPAMYDSSGRVHILTKHRIPHHASWARVMDTTQLDRRKGKDESYWPVGITGSKLMYLILKGREEYPGFPRPLIQEELIKLPFRNDTETEMESAAKQESLERGMLMRDMILDSLDDELTNEDVMTRELAMDKELVQLIQIACKASNIPRAIELAKLIHTPRTLVAAIKIADWWKMFGLKEKLERLKTIREDEEEDRLEASRAKRRRWNKAEAPLRRLPDNEDSAPMRSKPFQDFGSPPAIARPGLSRALPSVDSPKYQKTSISAKPWDESFGSPSLVATATPEGKRKRTPDLEPEESPTALMPPPKQSKPNPFARKPGPPAETSRNPFARRNDSNKVIQKSESFFEKVDKAEAGTKTKRSAKGKEKETMDKDKKDSLPRQQTLFDILPKGNGVPTKKSATPKPAKDSQATEDVLMSDVTMNDIPASDTTLVGTQTQPEESQDTVLPSDWEETQLTDES